MVDNAVRGRGSLPGTPLIETLLNPSWLDSSRHIELLSQAFPGFWNRDAYDWYLRRQFNGETPDILVRADGRKLLAAVSLIPREIRIAGGKPIRVAVMSAGGTRADERRRGHYAALLDATRNRARERGWSACLGFVTADNASGRGLLRLGARAIPSFYLTAQGNRTRRITPLNPAGPRWTARVSAARLVPADRHAGGAALFHYASATDWAEQFLERPHPVRVIRLAADSLAYVETAGSTDRLQRLDCPGWKTYSHILSLARSSNAAGRSLFVYSLNAHLAKILANHHFRVRRGHVTLWSTDATSREWEALSRASWSVQAGDRL
jgi:Acetyltransferase (GNAT) domain